MIKKILLTLASIFLIFQSYKLLTIIPNVEIASWGALFLVAWVINMFITGIFAFAGFAWPTQKFLSDTYYRVAHPRRLKKICSYLNVELFRKMLLATVWRNKNQQKKFFNGTKEGIANLILQSKKSEFGHLIPLVLLMGIGIYLMIMGLIELGVITILINIIGNLYPILLQRHHRMRIQRLADRMR